jgi:hypothetical protein
MRVFYLNPLYIEVCFWGGAFVAIAYMEIIHRYGWSIVSYSTHRVLSVMFSIYVIVLGGMIFVTTDAPPDYSSGRLFKHKAFATLIMILGLIFLIGSLIARKEQIEKVFRIREESSDTGTEQSRRP